MRNALAIPRGPSRLLAAFLMALLACQPVFSALPASGHRDHECRHDSCPMHRPVKAATPSCHGSHTPEGSRAEMPVPMKTGASCSLSASCGCGHPHSPGEPHHETPAVLAASRAAALSAPAGLAASWTDPGPSVFLPVPDPPPPQT